MDEPDISKLKPTKEDFLHSGIKTGLSMIPLAGPIIAEIFSFGVESPLEKKKNEFLIWLAKKLNELIEKNFLTIEDIKSNREFIDIVFTSLEIAMKNSQDEKINALKGIVTNTALNIDIQEDIKKMYLNLISDITPMHLKVLDLWYNSDEMVEKTVVEKIELNRQKQTYENQFVISDDFGKFLKIDDSVYRHIIKNLDTWNLLQNTLRTYKAGLPSEKRQEVIDGIKSNINEKLTNFGRDFLKFIKEPEI